MGAAWYRGELEKMRALLESEKQRQADLSTQCEEQERAQLTFITNDVTDVIAHIHQTMKYVFFPSSSAVIIFSI